MCIHFEVILEDSAKTFAGNNIISYYLGDMLSNAGIANTHVQLEIVGTSYSHLSDSQLTREQNIGLNAWCLVISLIGTWLVNKAGRKTMALASIGGMVIFMFLIGALTKRKLSR